MNIKPSTIFTGDNLDVLRGINSEIADLIYLDPPFNSNQDYAAPIGSPASGAEFKDTWHMNDVKVEEHGLLAEECPASSKVIDAAGDAHGRGMMAYLIMMASRMIELKRVLKPMGSIYLHCDPTASHYLKALMDAIFGSDQFRNEITWQRTESHNTAERYGNIADTILYYTKSDSVTWNQLFHDYSEAQLKRFRHIDENGRKYRLDDLTAPRPNSSSGKFEWRGTIPSPSRGWGYKLDQLEKWWNEGRIHVKRDGTPRMDGLKRYLDESEGKLLQNIWTDVPRIPNTSAERTGYPTQKPLKLLERILKASSNPGDLVLDPFCGCATTMVAAHNLDRKWIGIDISPKAVDLVRMRLKNAQKPMFSNLIVRTDIPRRTDLAPGLWLTPKNHKHALYGVQEGKCKGCLTHFPFRNFTIDHIVAQSKGGTDHFDNLQLLCGACNSMKGTKSQAEFLVALKEAGLRS